MYVSTQQVCRQTVRQAGMCNECIPTLQRLLEVARALKAKPEVTVGTADNEEQEEAKNRRQIQN
jgi:hypothetical protein